MFFSVNFDKFLDFLITFGIQFSIGLCKNIVFWKPKVMTSKNFFESGTLRVAGFVVPDFWWEKFRNKIKNSKVYDDLVPEFLIFRRIWDPRHFCHRIPNPELWSKKIRRAQIFPKIKKSGTKSSDTFEFLIWFLNFFHQKLGTTNPAPGAVPNSKKFFNVVTSGFKKTMFLQTPYWKLGQKRFQKVQKVLKFI